MDSLTIKIEYTIANNHGLLFTIVQNSIRFECKKRLVVYNDHNCWGVYSIASKVTFKIEKLPRIISHMIFGCNEEEGLKILKTLKMKGAISGKTEMALIGLNYEYYDKKFEISAKTSVVESLQGINIGNFVSYPQ